MSKISGLAGKAGFVILWAGFSLAAQAQTNSLSNPGFESDFSGWEQFFGRIGEWSSEDADGSGNSGSALLSNEGTSDGIVPLVLHQCIQVGGGVDLDFGGDLWVPPGQPADTAAYIFVEQFLNSSCSGNPGPFVSAGGEFTGGWGSASNSVVTTAGNQSVRLSLGVFKPNGETADAQAYFDNIYLLAGAPPPFEVNPSMSASWYNPAESGHGIMIHLLDANTAWMCWFTFDLDGNPAWICALGVIDGDTITFEEAFTVDGGAFPPNFDPEQIMEVPWGSIVVTFTGCNSGVMTWTTSVMGFQSGEMPIARLTDLWDVPCSGG
jgi:hypothetical protein